MSESHVLLLFFTGLIMGGAFGWAVTMDYVQRKYKLRIRRHATRRNV
jgi:hypothetical protein